MSSMKKLYDFSDFIECINKHVMKSKLNMANSNCKTNLSHGNDTNFTHLNDISEACFQRGSAKLYWTVTLMFATNLLVKNVYINSLGRQDSRLI